ncbi:MAG: DNA-processing protein DprA [Leucobacter sp.]
MASGIDRPYPAAHNQLLERIAQRGLVISEVPPGSAPTRQRFIDRARLQAALAGATVIVEAGAHSGSMRTAQEAQDLGHIVGAVPGPVTSAASYGTNQAIRDGLAQLVSGSFDFERLLLASESQQPPQPACNQTHQHKQWHSRPRSITPQGM